MEALRGTQKEAARDHFDRAIEILLECPVPVASDPRLGETYSDLVDSIHAMELEAVQNGEGLEIEETPAEELGKIEPSITPEKAAQERALAEEAQALYDIPVVLNTKVLAWIDIYTGPMRDKFEAGLRRSGWYLPMIQRIFKEEGVPQDLAYMAHVESSYKPYAYSRAKAKGIWQFIVDTGRRYGLRRDWWVDERSDPEMATRAAAAYLKELRDMFGDWYLAMAAYNAGEAKVQRAIDRTGSKDFWSLSNTSQLRLETKNYVPAILAATVISKSPARFGFNVEKELPIVYDKVPLDQPVDLRVVAKNAGTTVEELKKLNPSLYRLQTPPNYPGFELRLPPGTGQAFQIVYGSLSPSERLLAQEHTVQKGETLAAIAHRYGVAVSSLTSANNLKRDSALKAGMVLSVPTSLAPLTGLHPDRPGESGRIRS
ncbi:MAG: lytic transglycosylase, partial [Acidobacteria bacterium]